MAIIRRAIQHGKINVKWRVDASLIENNRRYSFGPPMFVVGREKRNEEEESGRRRKLFFPWTLRYARVSVCRILRRRWENFKRMNRRMELGIR